MSHPAKDGQYGVVERNGEEIVPRTLKERKKDKSRSQFENRKPAKHFGGERFIRLGGGRPLLGSKRGETGSSRRGTIASRLDGKGELDRYQKVLVGGERITT